MSYASDLAENRRRRVAARMNYGVFRLRKDGQASARPTLMEREYNAASAKVTYLQGLNPGNEYVVLPLVSR